jgi:hypothetical protein
MFLREYLGFFESCEEIGNQPASAESMEAENAAPENRIVFFGPKT